MKSKKFAGMEVLEARIPNLVYAQEIAIVATLHKIKEGDVSMVEMALAELNRKQILDLHGKLKAAMVNILMVILCSDKDATPIVNGGTLNHQERNRKFFPVNLMR